MKYSKKNSFQGFKFKQLIKRNKGNIKGIVSLIAAFLAMNYGDNVMMVSLFGASSGFATKFILDAIDFYTSEVTL